MTESKNATLEPHKSLTVIVIDTSAPTVRVVTKLVTVDSVPHTMRKGATMTLADVIANGEPAMWTDPICTLPVYEPDVVVM
jgi:hypothetical protein